MGSRGATNVSNQPQGSLPNFIDGIQVRITDKYRPPRQIILPPEYVNRTQQDIEAILDLDYDFKLEEEVLATYPTHNATDDSVDASKAFKTEQKASSTPERSASPGRPAPARPPPPVPKAGIAINPLFASVSYHPLEPQKVDAARPSSTVQDRGFRVEDFEPNSANPFDNLELKSLNDMDELQRVLAKDKETPP